MRTDVVCSQDIVLEGRRLTGGFYVSEDQLALASLRRARFPRSRVKDLVARRGIFRGPMFSRMFVEGPEHGEPYVSAKDIVASDVRPAGYLSRLHGPLLDELRLHAGMILVTCSGMNLGKAIWTRAEMDGLVASSDLIRIEPSSSVVPPGYLYAFLSSRHGHALIRKQIYGGHIKHIDPEHIANLPVPRLGEHLENAVHVLVDRAATLRTNASKALEAAVGSVESTLHAPSAPSARTSTIGMSVMHSVLQREMRFEGYYYNVQALAIDEWTRMHPNGFWTLGESEVADVFDVPPFKHIYVEQEHGLPFFTSGDLFLLDRHPDKYLSRTRTKDLRKYVLEQGWVLLARSGQLGGILGRPQFADSGMRGACASDHVIRIVARSVPAGYLYAYLATPKVGYVLLTRTMTGASIPALWPTFLRKLRVVKAATDFMAATHEQVVAAFEARLQATSLEDAARDLVERAIEKGAT